MTIEEAITELKAQLDAEKSHKSHKVNPDALLAAVWGLELIESLMSDMERSLLHDPKEKM
ncbi:MAG: hypothetical protein IKG01_14660 [Lachnospiraceae bacterium]|nr:hypothetical protein [Lachnospiraceae bacterium]